MHYIKKAAHKHVVLQTVMEHAINKKKTYIHIHIDTRIHTYTYTHT